MADRWKDDDIKFSRYIRNLYSKDGVTVECYTCGQVGFIAGMQNGHFNGRANLATRFDPDNCRPQCEYCNETLRGNKEVFREKLVEENGEEHVQALERKGKSTKHAIDLEIEIQNAEWKKKK